MMRLLALCAILFALAACTTTAPISSASGAGFVKIGVDGSYNEYRCTRSSCGGVDVEVSHSSGTGGIFAPALKASLSNAANRKALADEFFKGMSREQGIRLGPARAREIRGLEAYTSTGKISAGGSTFDLSVVLIVNDVGAEVFLSVDESASKARRGTLALADTWARSRG